MTQIQSRAGAHRRAILPVVTGVQGTIGFCYGKRGSELWEPRVLLAAHALLGSPALGVLGGGPYVMGLSVAGPSSGVPVLHVTFLWVPYGNFWYREPWSWGLWCVYGSLVLELPAQLSRCLLCEFLVWGPMMLLLFI